MTAWQSAGATDIGTTRKRNEDAFLDRPSAGVWAVADGMGGHAAGDVASRLAVDHLAEAIDNGLPREASARIETLITALEAANAAMLHHGETAALDTVGSTVAMVVRDGPASVRVLWSGDSRVYRWRDGTVGLLTRDHTLAEQIADTDPALAAMVTRSQAANTLTSVLGIDAAPRIDSAPCAVRPGDRLLICSDGLSGVLDNGALAALLAEVPVSEAGAYGLIQAALEAGSRDNVTAVLIGVA